MHKLLQETYRQIYARTDSKPKPTMLVQVYMPISTAEEEIETIYDIEELIQFVKGDENIRKLYSDTPS